MKNFIKLILYKIPIRPRTAAILAFILFNVGFFLPWAYLSKTLYYPNGIKKIETPVFIMRDVIAAARYNGHCLPSHGESFVKFTWPQKGEWITFISLSSLAFCLDYFQKFEMAPSSYNWRNKIVTTFVLIIYICVSFWFINPKMDCENLTLTVHLEKFVFSPVSVLSTIFSFITIIFAHQKHIFIFEDVSQNSDALA